MHKESESHRHTDVTAVQCHSPRESQAGEITVQELTQFKLAHKPQIFLHWLRWVKFAGYLTAAILIHAIVVIPALILRIVSYLLAGEPFIEIIKPVKRSDLY